MDIRTVTSKEDIATCLALRHLVFVDEQGVPEADEVDGLDADCTHILVRIDGEPVGAARIAYTADYAKIQRVCVLAHMRGGGVGAAVIRYMIAQIRARGDVGTIRLSAQITALEFYRRLGFTDVGDDYLDAGIMHRDMVLALGG